MINIAVWIGGDDDVVYVYKQKSSDSISVIDKKRGVGETFFEADFQKKIP